MQTEKQKKRAKLHKLVVKEYLQLSQMGGSKMALWDLMEKKTGYSRVWIIKILKDNGIIIEKDEKGNS